MTSTELLRRAAELVIETGFAYVDEGSGRTWEVVGHIADTEYLCIGESDEGKAPEVRRMAAAQIRERMSCVGPVVESFTRWRAGDDGRRCICCGRSERLTKTQHIEKCALARVERARTLSTPEARQARADRVARFQAVGV